MAAFNIQLEVANISLVQAQGKISARDKLGFLSSINPDPILKTAFIVGTGLDAGKLEFGHVTGFNYDKPGILGKGNDQKTKCTVIATVGGGITIDAVNKTDIRYVCLVGTAPPVSGAIRGGVCLDSIKLNGSRKNYLKRLSTTYDDTTIFLYQNRNSEMHDAEERAWGSGSKLDSAAGQVNGVNDAAQFASDFVRGGPLENAKAIVVSDDPFFRAKRGELIKQINSWLGRDTSRRAVYPSQMYGSPVQDGLDPPAAEQSVLYGPDLIEAYRLLGTLARCSFDDESAPIGFVSAIPHVVEL